MIVATIQGGYFIICKPVSIRKCNHRSMIWFTWCNKILIFEISYNNTTIRCNCTKYYWSSIELYMCEWWSWPWHNIAKGDMTNTWPWQTYRQESCHTLSCTVSYLHVAIPLPLRLNKQSSGNCKRWKRETWLNFCLFSCTTDSCVYRIPIIESQSETTKYL